MEVKDEKKDRYLVFFIVALVAVPIIWILNWTLVGAYYCSVETGGQFGDRFGASTSLFGGITTILLFLTLYLQRKDLKLNSKAIEFASKQMELSHDAIELSRKEMEYSKKSIENSTIELKRQYRQLKYQRFENTLFRLLELNNKNAYTVMPILVETFEKTWITGCFTKGVNNFELIKKEYNQNYITLVERSFGQYLNNFTVITNLINTKKSIETRKKYFQIYAAQLSIHEKIFLFYHFSLVEPPPFWEELVESLFRGMYYNHFNNPIHAQFVNEVIDILE